MSTPLQKHIERQFVLWAKKLTIKVNKTTLWQAYLQGWTDALGYTAEIWKEPK